MDSVTVDVKWQKQTFKGIEVDMNEPPAVFKSQLFSLTGVEPDRQKIMVKGGLLKDDTEWAKAGIKNGQRLMMMGTADSVPVAPAAAQVFIEDLPEDEQDVTGLSKYGAGLTNLGNTCYMNSTLQCFYGVEELRNALTGNDSSSDSRSMAEAGSRRLATATGQLFSQLERSAQPVPPYNFWSLLRQAFPQFDQQTSRQNESGTTQRGFAQQDAEECWTNLMTSLRSSVKDPSDGNTSLVDRLFRVKLRTSLKCEEGDETIEEETSALSLRCNINIDVNFLSEGIKLGLQDDREKQSQSLGRSAVYTGSSKVTSLPPYLTVQMVRFFYKADVKQKAKILRKVTFPLVLDAYEFASDELKAQLDGARSCETATEEAADKASKRQKRNEQAKKDEEAAAEAKAKRAARIGGSEVGTSTSSAPAVNADVDMVDPAEAVEAATQLRKKFAGQPTGRYDLTAVLTHKGRSADSGHYVAWVRQPDGTWVQFDDEQLIVRKQEEVLALSGGGDWHMAYLLVYKACHVKA